jgi:protein TonB
MYADTRYQPRKPRAVSLGAAFLINGAIIAGLIFSAPDFVKKIASGPIETYPVPEEVPPPPIEQPKPQPKAEVKPTTQPPITAPDPRVKTDSTVEMTTTTAIPDALPEPSKPVDLGPIAQPQPRVEPAPPLVVAVRDGRAAFQPDYPASELRLQRDGKVTVKVLVGTNGRVKAVEQLSATSSAFFDATKRQALSSWRFKPATRGGVAEESWMTLSVTFRIQDQ